MDNNNVANQFLDYLRYKRYSVNTINNYRTYLKRFTTEVTIPLHELNYDDISRWLFENNHIAPATMCKYISMLKRFFVYCVNKNYMKNVPIKSGWRPRIPVGLPKYLEPEETAALKVVSQKETLRNQLIVEMLFCTGLRRCELARVRLKDINFENRIVRVRGKGNKLMTAFLSPKALFLLEKHIKKGNYDNDSYIFQNKFGYKLSDKSIYDICIRLGKEADIKSPVHPHRARHTLATNLLRSGAPIQAVKALLNHAQIETTLIYAKAENEQLRMKYHQRMG